MVERYEILVEDLLSILDAAGEPVVVERDEEYKTVVEPGSRGLPYGQLMAKMKEIEQGWKKVKTWPESKSQDGSVLSAVDFTDDQGNKYTREMTLYAPPNGDPYVVRHLVYNKIV